MQFAYGPPAQLTMVNEWKFIIHALSSIIKFISSLNTCRDI